MPNKDELPRLTKDLTTHECKKLLVDIKDTIEWIRNQNNYAHDKEVVIMFLEQLTLDIKKRLKIIEKENNNGKKANK